MATKSTWDVTRALYAEPSPTASRSIQVLPMQNVTSIVFVVDDDVSVRESLELLIKSAGWRAEAFASGQDFLSRLGLRQQ